MDDKIKFIVICIFSILFVCSIATTLYMITDIHRFERQGDGDTIAWSVDDALIDAEKAIEDKDYESANESLTAAKNNLDILNNFINKHGDPNGSLTARLNERTARYDRISRQVIKEGSLIGKTITGKVVRVDDGDTFDFRFGPGPEERITIRVLNLDCPDWDRPEAYKYCKEIARDLIEGKQATVDIKDIDSNGRYLSNVSFSGGDFATVMKRETHGVCL